MEVVRTRHIGYLVRDIRKRVGGQASRPDENTTYGETQGEMHDHGPSNDQYRSISPNSARVDGPERFGQAWRATDWTTVGEARAWRDFEPFESHGETTWPHRPGP